VYLPLSLNRFPQFRLFQPVKIPVVVRRPLPPPELHGPYPPHPVTLLYLVRPGFAVFFRQRRFNRPADIPVRAVIPVHAESGVWKLLTQQLREPAFPGQPFPILIAQNGGLPFLNSLVHVRYASTSPALPSPAFR
jgi:hypothetical protein